MYLQVKCKYYDIMINKLPKTNIYHVTNEPEDLRLFSKRQIKSSWVAMH